MVALRYSDTLVPIYKTARRQNPQNHDSHFHHREIINCRIT